MKMLRAMLWFHWRSCRAWIVVAGLSAAALPAASIIRSGPHDAGNLPFFLAQLEAWGIFYPSVAAVLGLVMAGIVWQADRRGRFVYAFTLPIERWRYVWLRFAAGAAWIVAIGFALWAGALAALAVVRIPDLRGFPTVLALKFTLAAVSVFTTAYSIATLPDQVRRIGARVTLALVAAQVLAGLWGSDGRWLFATLQAVFGPWGPLALLGGRWMLIDV